jgi:hypothetical protein
MHKRATHWVLIWPIGWALLGGLGGGPAWAGPATGPTGFAEALRSAGWAVEVLADGSLELRPAPKSTGAEASAGEPGPEGQRPAPGVPTDWSILSRLGWRVQVEPDGSTLLYPPGAARVAPPPVAEPVAAAPEAALAGAQAELAQDLDALLAERGWRARRESDGALTLIPLLRLAAPGSAGPGGLAQAVRDARVVPPVDSWDEARALAQSWIDSTGGRGLQVGKIRRIHRVYLVSVVAAAAPRPLVHQLAVRVADGRVLVLD